MSVNTLFVRIDDTPIPKEVEQFCHPLDCRQKNDFYSFAGNVLLGDMKGPDGIPYYRIISPAGKLISDFKQADEKAFQCINKNWQNLLVLLLQDTNQSSVLNYTFPEEYTNWLLASNNEYINNIGDKLLNQNNAIEFSKEEILEEIVISKISKSISEELAKKQYRFVVVGSSEINSVSAIKRILSLEYNGTHLITYAQLENWGKLIEERRTKIRNSLTYDKFHSQNESFINQQIEYAFGKVMAGLEYIQGYAFFANFSIWKREKIGSIFEDDDFRRTFYECEKELADNISVKVKAFREDNEFNIYNDYEEKICNALGVDFIPIQQESFKDYYFPIDYRTAIRNFVKIIVDFNEYNANDDLGVGFVLSSVDSFITNSSNHYIEDLKRNLQHYYKYYCLGNLKDSFQMICSVYEPKVESSKNNNSSNGCYITTAMCNYLGKQDDCYELTILRGFRDNWLCRQTNGDRLIQEYYNYAPTIVDKLNHAPDKDSIYSEINRCIYKCLSYIREQQFEMAKDAYISMVRTLSHKFLSKQK